MHAYALWTPRYNGSILWDAPPTFRLVGNRMLRSCRLTSEAEITYPPDQLQVSPRLANVHHQSKRRQQLKQGGFYNVPTLPTQLRTARVDNTAHLKTSLPPRRQHRHEKNRPRPSRLLSLLPPRQVPASKEQGTASCRLRGAQRG